MPPGNDIPLKNMGTSLSSLTQKVHGVLTVLPISHMNLTLPCQKDFPERKDYFLSTRAKLWSRQGVHLSKLALVTGTRD